jgi:hypothetical protein
MLSDLATTCRPARPSEIAIATTWIAPALALVGSVLGVLLAQLLSGRFSRSLEESKRDWTERNRAYGDFLSAVARRAAAHTPKDMQDATVVLIDAKARIGIYGSAEVITKLAEFDRLGAQLRSNDAMSAFVAACEAMRADAPGLGHAPTADLARLILGPEADECPNSTRP